MTGTAIVTEIVSTLVSGITGVANGVGAGLSTLAESIFMTGTGESQTISTFGILIVCFAGVSLAELIVRASLNWWKNREHWNVNPNGSYYLKVVNTCNA